MNAAPGTRLGQLPALFRLCIRQAHSRAKPRRSGAANIGPPGHGEKVWIFAHRRTDQIIYSFHDKLDGLSHRKQLAFNGKKTKPAKVRKDYWSPMLVIRFPAGQGAIGRSVYQKLRELRHLHEVSWGDEVRQKQPEEFTDEDKAKVAEAEALGKEYHPIRNKKERGAALNAQKANAIADLAVVLAGQGAGNKMVVDESDEGEKKLLAVEVCWDDPENKEYAEAWSPNVTHRLFGNYDELMGPMSDAETMAREIGAKETKAVADAEAIARELGVELKAVGAEETKPVGAKKTKPVDAKKTKPVGA